MKTYGGSGSTDVFLPSAVDGGEWSVSRPRPLYPAERAPGTHWIVGWVDTRAGLYDMKE
jgi:hypothetical protein